MEWEEQNPWEKYKKNLQRFFSQNLHSTNEITLNQSISIPKGRHETRQAKAIKNQVQVRVQVPILGC